MRSHLLRVRLGEGTVREDNNLLRITSRVVNADGFQIWSERFETEPDTQSLFKVSERIASALVSRIRAEQSLIRAGIVAITPQICYPYSKLAEELARLERGEKHVEKPNTPGASKDLADCLAAVVHHCHVGWAKGEGATGLFKF